MIEMISPLLAIHMKPLPEGEGPSSHSNDAMKLANSLEVLVYRIPMTMASRLSPLVLCIQTHIVRPLQVHFTDILRSVQLLTPKPLGFCNKSIPHTGMKSWTRPAFRLCLLPPEVLGHMSLRIGLNTRTRQCHNCQGFQPHSNIPIRTQRAGSDSVQSGRLQG